MIVKKIVENRKTKKRFCAEIDGYIKDENGFYSRTFKPVKLILYRKEAEFRRIIKIIKYDNYNDFEKEWRVVKYKCAKVFKYKIFHDYLEHEKRRYI